VSQENAEIVRSIYEAVTRRDSATPFEVYAEDIVWDVSNSGRATLMKSVYRGHEGVRQMWRDAVEVFGEVDLDVEELIDAGEQVVAVICERVIGRTSGAPGKASHVAVWTLADGKVVRMQIFDNRDQALKAVGLEE
jgi:ketosteroid isomerase-like protein